MEYICVKCQLGKACPPGAEHGLYCPERPNLSNASAIKANAEKLLEDQKRVAEAQHSIQSAYFDLRRVAGESAANRFVASLMIVPF